MCRMSNSMSCVLLLAAYMCIIMAASGGMPGMQSSSRRGTRNNMSINLGVNHVFDPHSPFRPPGCDDACVWEHRVHRLNASLSSRRTQYRSTSAATGSSSGLTGKRQLLQTLPYAFVTTNSFRSGSYAEYYVRLTVGDSSQPALMIVDTGSDLSWIQCKPCDPCYPQYYPVFNPRRSGTLARLAQGNQFCDDVQAVPGIGQGADATSCHYQLSYADGSGSTGVIVSDQINLWEGSNPGTYVAIPGVGFGCGTTNMAGPGVPTFSSGVLGLGYGRSLSWTEQFSFGHLIPYFDPIFTFCFAPIGSPIDSGFLKFGPDAIPSQDYYETALIGRGAEVYYYIDVVDILVAGQTVGVPPGLFDIDDSTLMGGVIVDSGDTLSIIHPTAYTLFRDAWRAAMRPILGDPDPSGTPGPHGLDTCWDYPTPYALPAISFLLGDNNIFTLSDSASTLVYKTSNGNQRMCFPFLAKQPNDTIAAMVIGAVSLHNTQIIVDLDNNMFGWLYQQC